MIWLGDEQAGDATIYVAMSMMRSLIQVRKILWSTLECGEGQEQWDRVPIGDYTRHKIDKMWGIYGFGPKLHDVVQKYPKHRILVSGISHGATLAQAAALRLKPE